jgi:hypothetical protein
VRERHEQGLLNSLEFLKAILEIAKEVVEAENRVDPEEEQDRAIAALTELFNEVKNKSTHVIVERLVADIDAIVRQIRFDGWQTTSAGEREVQKALRSTAEEVPASHRPGTLREGLRIHSAVLLSSSSSEKNSKEIQCPHTATLTNDASVSFAM